MQAVLIAVQLIASGVSVDQSRVHVTNGAVQLRERMATAAAGTHAERSRVGAWTHSLQRITVGRGRPRPPSRPHTVSGRRQLQGASPSLAGLGEWGFEHHEGWSWQPAGI